MSGLTNLLFLVETNSVKLKQQTTDMPRLTRQIVIAVSLAFVFCILVGRELTVNAEDPAASAKSGDRVVAKVIDLWPNTPPHWAGTAEKEHDTTTSNGDLIAGKPVIRLGYVSKPQLHFYQADAFPGPMKNPNADTIVLICPGGGYSILAWDLEGTEIASRFNSLGVSAGVVKYRVPTRQSDEAWLAPVQDIQRAVSQIRSMAMSEGTSNTRVGLVGFSAGGNAAARVATAAGKRFYAPVDAIDEASCQVDFAGLVYPWLMVDDPASGKGFNAESTNRQGIISDLTITSSTPPMFFAHAIDDRISCYNSIQLFSVLKSSGVPAELHVFASGGHGFGARDKELPAAIWPEQMVRWLSVEGSGK